MALMSEVASLADETLHASATAEKLAVNKEEEYTTSYHEPG